MAAGSTTPTAEAPPGPSTSDNHPTIGDTVLVRLDVNVWRPLTVAAWAFVVLDTETGAVEFRISGPIACAAGDHTTPAFRGWSAGGHDPARITGRPDRQFPFGYGEDLVEGDGVGQWRRRC